MSADMQQLLDADDARFLLTRTGFSPPPREVARLVGMTRAQALAGLLDGARTQCVTPLPDWVRELPPPRAVRAAYTPDERRAERQLRNRRYDELRAWWVREMLVTPSPLTERMTLFWHNHFTSGQDKVPYPQTMAAQNTLLRAAALGNFGTLLHSVAKDPAMLQYLDGASNRKGRPNENFAREVMELFTLGEGHYTQRDVSEAARAYTGWGVDPDTLGYVFMSNLHDDGEKTVLGETGRFDGDAVLDILLARPETARFIVAKLWREFISDTPDASTVEHVAGRFRQSGYDIRTALAGLLSSEAFWAERNRGVLVKSPVEFVVGTVRLFDVDYGDTGPFVNTLRTLGQNLFYPPNVKGWPGGATWINSATLLARKQFVEQMMRATEAAGRHAAPAPASAPGAMMDGKPAMRRGMRFDIDTWLAAYRTKPQAQPDLSTQLQLQHAVLPLSPVAATETGATSMAYLQALLMDPAYQLK
ncbi:MULTISPECIES: DUF1800 domain-containing protein [Burkholderia]|uniref:DUF1800 domain-containing protein n=1 Tax=Burkholderia TaxID=32008 RepID=UPI001E2B0C22|nr:MULTISPECIES: DUF1800 domain-containing protein [unclassified Burkholderia]